MWFRGTWWKWGSKEARTEKHHRMWLPWITKFSVQKSEQGAAKAGLRRIGKWSELDVMWNRCIKDKIGCLLKEHLWNNTAVWYNIVHQHRLVNTWNYCCTFQVSLLWVFTLDVKGDFINANLLIWTDGWVEHPGHAPYSSLTQNNLMRFEYAE